MQQRRCHARDLLQRDAAPVAARNAADKPLCIRVAGIVQHGVHRPLFHNAPGVHNADLVGQPGDDSQIVRNPDHSSSRFTTEFLRLMEYLCLNGHIQRRSRLIRNNQIGPVQ